MKKSKYRNPLLLLLTATIWGFAFVAQSVGTEYLRPFTFNCIRSLLGGLVLLPVIWVLNRKSKIPSGDSYEPQDLKILRRTTWIGGLICGLLLASASSLQQIGIEFTTVGKAGFITACYIILVPIIGLFLKKKCSPLIWVSVVLALAGLYLLCIRGGFSIAKGDIYIFISAILFSLHILTIDHYAPRVDGVKMSCIQFFVSSICCGVIMFLVENPRFGDIIAAWQPLLYAGVMSCGIAYTLQIIGQRGVEPTVASLILSLESSISVLAGWLILGQRLNGQEILGCATVFAAIILAQLPAKSTNTSSTPRKDKRLAG